MSEYKVFNILDMAEAIGETNLRELLSDFSCPKNEEIQRFGKNYALEEEKRLSGNKLMDLTFEVLERVQHDVGGGIVFLECEDNPQLLDFYQNDKNGFIPFDERYSVPDNTKYIQLFHFF